MSGVVEWTGAADKVKKPKCGGIFLDENDSSANLTPWVGSDPDRNVNCYSYNENSKKWEISTVTHKATASDIKGPNHPGQFRPQNHKAFLKTRNLCVTYDGVKFAGIPSKEKGGKSTIAIKVFKDICRRHMIVTGMWDVFSIPDPDTSTNKKWDLFKDHARIPSKHVTKYIKDLKDDVGTDSYALQNLEWSGIYLQNSITHDLLAKVLRLVPITASGPEVFMAILSVCYSDSYDALEQTKTNLKLIKLKDYPGENVEECVTVISQLAERLDSAGAFEPQLLCSIMKIFEHAKDERFRLWAMSKYKECANYNKELRFGSNPTTMTYEEICQDAVTEYKSLVDSKRWTVEDQTSKEEPSLPKSYLSQIKQSVADQLKQSLPKKTDNNSPVNLDNTNGSKSTKQSDKKGEGRSKEDQNSSKGKWYLDPPKDGKTERKRFGKTYKWCKICKSWRFHDASGHDKWKERQEQRKKDENKPDQKPQATLAVDSFGGLCSIME